MVRLKVEGRRRLGIRAKLLLVSLSLIALSFAAADVYVTHALEGRLVLAVQEDLLVRTDLLVRDVSPSCPAPGDADAWQRLAKALGPVAHSRVTFIRRDGVVLGDSELDEAQVLAMPNHAGKPEIRAAFEQGHGASDRESVSMRKRLLYVAERFTSAASGEPVVVRVASSLEPVRGTIQHLRHLLAFATLLAVCFALLMSTFAASWISGVVRELTATARRMSEGDLGARTHVRTSDDLGDLAATLDQLASGVGTTLAKLRQERDLQGRILDGMEEGVLVLDKDGRIEMMNPALRQMLLLGADAVGRLLLEVVRHADLHDLVKRARVGRTTAMGEIDLPGIKPRRLLTHATALAGEAGGLLAVCVDVTDLRRLESLRRDFVANVSHELRTPVTAVRSAAETLQVSALRDPDPAVAAHFVEIVSRNAERLQSLIEDLLELSRLESKEFKLKKDRIDLTKVASIIFGLFRGRADDKRITLAADLPADLPLLHTDQRALEQVLSNLVENAVKYCPAGSTVTLRASTEASGRGDGGSIRVLVADNGPGIDPKHVPRLFERFYRVDAGRSRDVGGTGLGLSIVKHLVEAMGGSVTVESNVGRGSTFTVTLPAATLPAAA